MKLEDVVRFSWMVNSKSIPSRGDDRELAEAVIGHNPQLNVQLGFKNPPEGDLFSCWEKIIATPIIDQMRRTKVKAGRNSFDELSAEDALSIMNLTCLAPDQYAQCFVFSTFSAKAVDAYISKLCLSYVFTTEKIACVKSLTEILDTLLSFDAEEKEQLCKHGMLIITDCMGAQSRLEKIDGVLATLLADRYRRGRVTVLILLSDVIKQLTVDEYKEMLMQSAFAKSKVMCQFLSAESSCVYSIVTEGDIHVSRVLLPTAVAAI